LARTSRESFDEGAAAMNQQKQQFPSKKISKKAENYIESILTKLSTSKELLNDKALNNTYSYTRQVEENETNRRNG